MKTYGKWSPTAFDPKGWILDNREDWLVVPVMQTRDSEVLNKSNFAAALEILGGERKCIEVHRFGHWGPGWIEIIIVHPRLRKLVEGIEKALENYAVLDEQDYHKREWEEFEEAWNSYGCKELIDDLQEEFEFDDFIYDLLNDVETHIIRGWWMNNSNEPYYQDSGGCVIPTRRWVKKSTKEDLIKLCWSVAPPPTVNCKGVRKWLFEINESLGNELELPAFLFDSTYQLYLFPDEVHKEKQALARFLGVCQIPIPQEI